MNFHNRRYAIIASGDVGLINFSHVLETSENTLRYSVDGTKTFVKYDCMCNCETMENCTCCPECIDQCPSHSGLLTIEEMHAILDTPEWTAPMEEEYGP